MGLLDALIGSNSGAGLLGGLWNNPFPPQSVNNTEKKSTLDLLTQMMAGGVPIGDSTAANNWGKGGAVSYPNIGGPADVAALRPPPPRDVPPSGVFPGISFAPPPPQAAPPMPPPAPVNNAPAPAPQVTPPQALPPPVANANAADIPQAAPQGGDLSMAFQNWARTPQGNFWEGLANAAQGLQGGKSSGASLQKTGTDPFTGQDTFAWVTPYNQKITPATMGGQPGGGANVPGMQSFSNALNQGVKGEALYQYLPPQAQGTIKAWIEGREPIPGPQNRNPITTALLQAANAIDPTLNTGEANARNKAMASFYGAGKDAETARKMRQSALHFAELTDKMANTLPGHQMPIMNSAQNFIETQLLGKGTAGNFMINAHALADELSGLWKGQGISDAEIKAWESKLSPNMSREQQIGMAHTLLGLYKDGITELNNKRQQDLGPILSAKMVPLMSPEASQALGNVEQFANSRLGGQSGTGSITRTGVKWSIVQ